MSTKIIEKILSNKTSNSQAISEIVADDASLINSRTFFTENNAQGYIAKSDFKSYVETFSRKNLEELDYLLKEMSTGMRFNSLLIRKHDFQNRPYFWLQLSLPNGSPGVKFLITASLDRFIREYQYGKIKVNITLEDLYEEACQD